MSATPRPSEDEFLDRDEVCELLKISRRTLWELERVEKAPPSVKFGRTVRFPKTLLDNFLQAQFEAAS